MHHVNRDHRELKLFFSLNTFCLCNVYWLPFVELKLLLGHHELSFQLVPLLQDLLQLLHGEAWSVGVRQVHHQLVRSRCLLWWHTNVITSRPPFFPFLYFILFFGPELELDMTVKLTVPCPEVDPSLMILSSSLFRLSRSIFSSSRDKLYLFTNVSNISRTRTILNCKSDTSSPALLIFNKSRPITYEMSYTSSTVSSKASFSKARTGDASSPNSMMERFNSFGCQNKDFFLLSHPQLSIYATFFVLGYLSSALYFHETKVTNFELSCTSPITHPPMAWLPRQ